MPNVQCACPGCRLPLRIAQALPAQVRCPRCGETFVVQAAPGPALSAPPAPPGGAPRRSWAAILVMGLITGGAVLWAVRPDLFAGSKGAKNASPGNADAVAARGAARPAPDLPAPVRADPDPAPNLPAPPTRTELPVPPPAPKPAPPPAPPDPGAVKPGQGQGEAPVPLPEFRPDMVRPGNEMPDRLPENPDLPDRDESQLPPGLRPNIPGPSEQDESQLPPDPFPKGPGPSENDEGQPPAGLKGIGRPGMVSAPFTLAPEEAIFLKVSLRAGVPVTIRVDTEAARPEPDVDLFVFGPDGNLAALDEGAGKDCRVRFTPRVTGMYRLRVVNLGPGTSRSRIACQ